MSCSLAKRALDPRICLAIDSLQESEDTIKNQQRINLKECLRTIVRPLMNLREDESSPVADLKHGVETCLALLEDWRSCNEAYSRRLIDVDILLEIPGPRWIPKTNRKLMFLDFSTRISTKISKRLQMHSEFFWIWMMRFRASHDRSSRKFLFNNESRERSFDRRSTSKCISSGSNLTSR